MAVQFVPRGNIFSQIFVHGLCGGFGSLPFRGISMMDGFVAGAIYALADHVAPLLLNALPGKWRTENEQALRTVKILACIALTYFAHICLAEKPVGLIRFTLFSTLSLIAMPYGITLAVGCCLAGAVVGTVALYGTGAIDRAFPQRD